MQNLASQFHLTKTPYLIIKSWSGPHTTHEVVTYPITLPSNTSRAHSCFVSDAPEHISLVRFVVDHNYTNNPDEANEWGTRIMSNSYVGRTSNHLLEQCRIHNFQNWNKAEIYTFHLCLKLKECRIFHFITIPLSQSSNFTEKQELLK